jgi:hypothetical protein
MSEVKIIRLISGEEIIANYTDNGDTIHLKDASVLIPSPEGKLLLARWLPYADTKDGVNLEKRHLVFVLNPQKELADHFTNVVVNGLVIPGKKVVDPLAGSGLKLTV